MITSSSSFVTTEHPGTSSRIENLPENKYMHSGAHTHTHTRSSTHKNGEAAP